MVFKGSFPRGKAVVVEGPTRLDVFLFAIHLESVLFKSKM